MTGTLLQHQSHLFSDLRCIFSACEGEQCPVGGENIGAWGITGPEELCTKQYSVPFGKGAVLENKRESDECLAIRCNGWSPWFSLKGNRTPLLFVVAKVRDG